MRRRALLGSLAAGTVVGSAGCLTTLGLAERGPVTGKFVVRVTDGAGNYEECIGTGIEVGDTVALAEMSCTTSP